MANEGMEKSTQNTLSISDLSDADIAEIANIKITSPILLNKFLKNDSYDFYWHCVGAYWKDYIFKNKEITHEQLGNLLGFDRSVFDFYSLIGEAVKWDRISEEQIDFLLSRIAKSEWLWYVLDARRKINKAENLESVIDLTREFVTNKQWWAITDLSHRLAAKGQRDKLESLLDVKELTKKIRNEIVEMLKVNKN
jgi:hypothetical protein